MSRNTDALVIGASPSGLVAAVYLAQAGLQVQVVEAEAVPGGNCASVLSLENFPACAGPHTFHALDPRMIKDLKLMQRGFAFAARDMELVGLRIDGEPLQIDRDVHAVEQRIAALSQRDADRFADIRRDLFAFARAMRAEWWDEGASEEQAVLAERRHLGVTGAAAFLDSAFESEPLKAVFLFDAMVNGAAPSAAGTSMLIAWRAAQEMCGLQGATAIPKGGAGGLLESLLKAAETAGVEITTRAKVTQLKLAGDRATGAVLEHGEEIYARVVLSSLSRRRSLLDLAPAGAAGFAAVPLLRRSQEVGEARLLLLLNATPGFAARVPTGRFIIIDRIESCIAGHAEARAGRLPEEFALEVVMPSGVDPALAPARKQLLSVCIRPVPVVSGEAWRSLGPQLVETVMAMLERHAPGLRQDMLARELVLPEAPGCDPMSMAHVLGDWRSRILTPIQGLLLCGETAEPVPAFSGRAARIASAMALAFVKEERAS